MKEKYKEIPSTVQNWLIYALPGTEQALNKYLLNQWPVRFRQIRAIGSNLILSILSSHILHILGTASSTSHPASQHERLRLLRYWIPGIEPEASQPTSTSTAQPCSLVPLSGLHSSSQTPCWDCSFHLPSHLPKTSPHFQSGLEGKSYTFFIEVFLGRPASPHLH